MERYSVITQKCGCHILSNSFLASVKKYLKPAEIIFFDSYFKYSKRSQDHSTWMNEGIRSAKTNLIIFADHDILVLDSEYVNRMIQVMQGGDVLACGYHDYSFDGVNLLLPDFTMINRDLFLKNGKNFGGGNPLYSAFSYAHSLGQKMIKLESGKSIFHFGEGESFTYSSLIVESQFRNKFEAWKKTIGSNANFGDYVVDDGMDLADVDWLNWQVLGKLEKCIVSKNSFSTIRLGDLGLRYLYNYFFDLKDFTHVGLEHPDLAMPNDELGRKLIEELIENMKNADWVDHPDLYKGVFGDLYGWRGVLNRIKEIYEKAGIVGPFCSSLQGYLGFVKEFEVTLYDIMKGRRIMYVGPSDELGYLIKKKDLEVSKYKFYQLSLSANHMDRYKNMEAFMPEFNPNDWDVVFVTGSLYGRTIIGRIKKAGGRAFDLGQAVSFNPNNIFETVIEAIENRTYYKLKSHYQKGKDYAPNSQKEN